MLKRLILPFPVLLTALLLLAPCAPASAQMSSDLIYPQEQLKPVDSAIKVKVGDKAPDFELPCVDGGTLRLSEFLGQDNVVLSFVPAAFTPVCSAQWPGYNIAHEIFDDYDTMLIGITVDNIPTLFAWTREMGLWFPVVSDFWPHGAVAARYGVLRGDGTAERCLILVDKQGIIRYIDVHDVNSRPDFGKLVEAMKKLQH